MTYPAETPTVKFDLIVAGHYRRTDRYHELRKKGTDDWLLIHTVAGKGLLYIPQGQSILAEPGHTVVYRPRTRQEYGIEPAAPAWELIWAHFHPPASWAEELLHWPHPTAGIFHLPKPPSDTYRRVLRALRAMVVLERGPWRQAQRLAMNALEEAILWLSAANQSMSHLTDPQITAAEQYLCDHLAEPISLSALADATAQSVSKLSHSFGKQTGLSPRAFLEQRRLARAARLLISTRMPIKKIAEQVGFASPFYFSLRFKKYMGISPRRWREGEVAHVYNDESRTIRGKGR